MNRCTLQGLPEIALRMVISTCLHTGCCQKLVTAVQARRTWENLLAGLHMQDGAGGGRHTCRLRIAAPGTAPPAGRGCSFVVGPARANPSLGDGGARAAPLPLHRLPQAPLSPHTSGLAFGKPREPLQHTGLESGEATIPAKSAISAIQTR